MDTSRTYVKMCRNAKQIQSMWHPSTGDWCYFGSRDDCKKIRVKNKNSTVIKTDENTYNFPSDIDLHGIVWLPAKNQLKNLLYLNFNGEQMDNFLKFTEELESEQKTSKEQLWLMYYMAVTHQKQWEDGRWVISEKNTVYS